ncbi:hypothetical protein ACP4OV_002700 [Aristida adscensionis]
MSTEHEDTVTVGEHVAGKKHGRRRKKAAKDPLASSYGEVSLGNVPRPPPTELGFLRFDEAPAGGPVVAFASVRAIRPVSSMMAVVELKGCWSITLRCVVVAGAFDGTVTVRTVRFATTLRKYSSVFVDGVVSIPKRTVDSKTQQMDIQVKKLYYVTTKDTVRSDEEHQGRGRQVCPTCRGSGTIERAPGA